MQPTTRYLRRVDAADYVRKIWGIPCSPKWLAKLAVIGGGPIFRKAGRFPIYLPSDLDAWADARIGEPRRSTSVGAEYPAESAAKVHMTDVLGRLSGRVDKTSDADTTSADQTRRHDTSKTCTTHRTQQVGTRDSISSEDDEAT
jgi:hypothetical protein